MIKKVIVFIIPFCFILAVFLHLNGYTKVELGNDFYAFMGRVSLSLANWKIEIPSIPSIELFEAPSGIFIVVNFLIRVVNGLAGLINFIITILNYIIYIIQFICTIFYEIVQLLKDWGANISLVHG